MNRINRIISAITLTCFLINTAISDLALAQNISLKPDRDNLAASSKFDDIKGYAHQDMARIELTLETQLLKAAKSGDGIDIESLVKSANEYRDSIFKSAVQFARPMHLFTNEVAALPCGWHRVMCRVNGGFNGVRTYYAVFPDRRDGKGGFPIEVYTEKEWSENGVEKVVKEMKTVPQRRQEKADDALAILRYKENNEKIISEFICERLAAGDFAEIEDRAVGLGWDSPYPNRIRPPAYWSGGIMPHMKKELNSFLGVFGIDFDNISRGKNIVFVKVPDAIGFPVIMEQGQKVKVKSRTSSNAVYFFIPEKEFTELNEEMKYAGISKLPVSGACDAVRFDLVHEIGAACGLDFEVTAGHIWNRLDKAYSEFRDLTRNGWPKESIEKKMREEYPDLLGLESVNLDILRGTNSTGEPYERDYAAGQKPRSKPSKLPCSPDKRIVIRSGDIAYMTLNVTDVSQDSARVEVNMPAPGVIAYESDHVGDKVRIENVRLAQEAKRRLGMMKHPFVVRSGKGLVIEINNEAIRFNLTVEKGKAPYFTVKASAKLDNKLRNKEIVIEAKPVEKPQEAPPTQAPEPVKPRQPATDDRLAGLSVSRLASPETLAVMTTEKSAKPTGMEAVQPPAPKTPYDDILKEAGPRLRAAAAEIINDEDLKGLGLDVKVGSDGGIKYVYITVKNINDSGDSQGLQIGEGAMSSKTPAHFEIKAYRDVGLYYSAQRESKDVDDAGRFTALVLRDIKNKKQWRKWLEAARPKPPEEPRPEPALMPETVAAQVEKKPSEAPLQPAEPPEIPPAVSDVTAEEPAMPEMAEEKVEKAGFLKRLISFFRKPSSDKPAPGPKDERPTAGTTGKLSNLATHDLVNALVAMAFDEASKRQAGEDFITSDTVVIRASIGDRVEEYTAKVFWFGFADTQNATFLDIFNWLAKKKALRTTFGRETTVRPQNKLAVARDIADFAGLSNDPGRREVVDNIFVAKLEWAFNRQIEHFGIGDGDTRNFYAMRRFKPVSRLQEPIRINLNNPLFPVTASYLEQLLFHAAFEGSLHEELIECAFGKYGDSARTRYREWRTAPQSQNAWTRFFRSRVKINNSQWSDINGKRLTYNQFAEWAHQRALARYPLKELTKDIVPADELGLEKPLFTGEVPVAGTADSGQPAAKADRFTVPKFPPPLPEGFLSSIWEWRPNNEGRVMRMVQDHETIAVLILGGRWSVDGPRKNDAPARDNVEIYDEERSVALTTVRPSEGVTPPAMYQTDLLDGNAGEEIAAGSTEEDKAGLNKFLSGQIKGPDERYVRMNVMELTARFAVTPMEVIRALSSLGFIQVPDSGRIDVTAQGTWQDEEAGAYNNIWHFGSGERISADSRTIKQHYEDTERLINEEHFNYARTQLPMLRSMNIPAVRVNRLEKLLADKTRKTANRELKDKKLISIFRFYERYLLAGKFAILLRDRFTDKEGELVIPAADAREIARLHEKLRPEPRIMALNMEGYRKVITMCGVKVFGHLSPENFSRSADELFSAWKNIAGPLTQKEEEILRKHVLLFTVLVPYASSRVVGCAYYDLGKLWHPANSRAADILYERLDHFYPSAAYEIIKKLEAINVSELEGAEGFEKVYDKLRSAICRTTMLTIPIPKKADQFTEVAGIDFQGSKVYVGVSPDRSEFILKETMAIPAANRTCSHEEPRNFYGTLYFWAGNADIEIGVKDEKYLQVTVSNPEILNGVIKGTDMRAPALSVEDRMSPHTAAKEKPRRSGGRQDPGKNPEDAWSVICASEYLRSCFEHPRVYSTYSLNKRVGEGKDAYITVSDYLEGFEKTGPALGYSSIPARATARQDLEKLTSFLRDKEGLGYLKKLQFRTKKKGENCYVLTKKGKKALETFDNLEKALKTNDESAEAECRMAMLRDGFRPVLQYNRLRDILRLSRCASAVKIPMLSVLRKYRDEYNPSLNDGRIIMLWNEAVMSVSPEKKGLINALRYELSIEVGAADIYAEALTRMALLAQEEDAGINLDRIHSIREAVVGMFEEGEIPAEQEDIADAILGMINHMLGEYDKGQGPSRPGAQNIGEEDDEDDIGNVIPRGEVPTMTEDGIRAEIDVLEREERDAEKRRAEKDEIKSIRERRDYLINELHALREQRKAAKKSEGRPDSGESPLAGSQSAATPADLVMHPVLNALLAQYLTPHFNAPYEVEVIDMHGFTKIYWLGDEEDSSFLDIFDELVRIRMRGKRERGSLKRSEAERETAESITSRHVVGSNLSAGFINVLRAQLDQQIEHFGVFNTDDIYAIRRYKGSRDAIIGHAGLERRIHRQCASVLKCDTTEGEAAYRLWREKPADLRMEARVDIPEYGIKIDGLMTYNKFVERAYAAAEKAYPLAGLIPNSGRRPHILDRALAGVESPVAGIGSGVSEDGESGQADSAASAAGKTELWKSFSDEALRKLLDNAKRDLAQELESSEEAMLEGVDDYMLEDMNDRIEKIRTRVRNLKAELASRAETQAIGDEMEMPGLRGVGVADAGSAVEPARADLAMPPSVELPEPGLAQPYASPAELLLTVPPAPIEMMTELAGQIGREIAPPLQNYTLFASYDLLTDDEYRADKRSYRDRFGLERILTNRPDEMVDWVLDAVKKNSLTAADVIAQLPAEFANERYRGDLERITSAGIKYMVIDTYGMKDEVEGKRKKYRENIYARMLLARAINTETDSGSPLYRLLRFLIESHIEDFDGKEALVNEYMDAIKNNHVINVMLSYKPIKRYETAEKYEGVAAALMSA